MPLVVRAEYCDAFRIRVSFNNGATGLVDFEPWMNGPVFEPLRNVDYFRRFFVDGGTVAWPNGADIAPEAVYDAVTAAGASATADEPESSRSRG